MASSGFTEDDIRAWLDGVQADLRSVEARIAPLAAEQKRLEEREALLRELLRSFGGDQSQNGLEAANAGPSESVAAYVVARAVEILKEAGEPVHINDLHARFLARGFTVPGAGAPANLIVHLRKAPEIASPQRGMYGLTEDIGPTPSRRAVKRSTTRRRKRG